MTEETARVKIDTTPETTLDAPIIQPIPTIKPYILVKPGSVVVDVANEAILVTHDSVIFNLKAANVAVIGDNNHIAGYTVACFGNRCNIVCGELYASGRGHVIVVSHGFHALSPTDASLDVPSWVLKAQEVARRVHDLDDDDLAQESSTSPHVPVPPATLIRHVDLGSDGRTPRLWPKILPYAGTSQPPSQPHLPFMPPRLWTAKQSSPGESVTAVTPSAPVQDTPDSRPLPTSLKRARPRNEERLWSPLDLTLTQDDRVLVEGHFLNWKQTPDTIVPGCHVGAGIYDLLEHRFKRLDEAVDSDYEMTVTFYGRYIASETQPRPAAEDKSINSSTRDTLLCFSHKELIAAVVDKYFPSASATGKAGKATLTEPDELAVYGSFKNLISNFKRLFYRTNGLTEDFPGDLVALNSIAIPEILKHTEARSVAAAAQEQRMITEKKQQKRLPRYLTRHAAFVTHVIKEVQFMFKTVTELHSGRVYTEVPILPASITLLPQVTPSSPPKNGGEDLAIQSTSIITTDPLIPSRGPLPSEIHCPDTRAVDAPDTRDDLIDSDREEKHRNDDDPSSSEGEQDEPPRKRRRTHD